MSESSPRIKSGWIRATLFFIVSLITSQIFAGIGLVVVLIATGFDLSALSNQEEITNAVKGVKFLLPLKVIEFLSVMLCAWLFIRFIDRKPLKSIGLILNSIL